ncbi:hypothetical protein SARC_02803 [Sphaeroforma arctica JP610]|uniref:Protein arginine N-methyltransferase n=1 Tax=Sphaeroforma arctica JP610 TaxID=667725 RepID=A0A0L0G7G7_9EUKA|nr:hypothetical protein SARC_02803 [Sphaeroforma arctica JP610]KNC84982.1 hypothetical protein SARC_02803 [Sphaeroforma arctica JP610]|eukprot:XP_014158884.1 hypothetical protein SARC_02803 [Sphaeroforma arctica JP610]
MVKQASLGRIIQDDEDDNKVFSTFRRQEGLNFIVCPLTNEKWRKDVTTCIGEKREPPVLDRDHVRVIDVQNNHHTVGMVSPFLALHSKSQFVRESFQHVFNAAPTDTPIDDDIEDFEAAERPWRMWNQFRSLCDHSNKLNVCLELTEDLPCTGDALDRWMGEPVKAVALDTKLFMTDKEGNPVLSKAHENVLRRFISFDAQILLTGQVQHSDGVEPYVHYLQMLNERTRTSPDFAEYEVWGNGYEDYLQAPLQPLMNNLESGVYAVFEQDPVKYREYQEAVFRALCDRVPAEKKDEVTTVIMVVGAGRGPLVRMCLKASERANRKVKMYAVEKNPNAIITLQGWKADTWGDKVTLHAGDMRDFKPNEKCDILVSELLGSFGDNELSPECLDGAQRYLKDDMPYVVLMHNHTRIAPSLPLFTFDHPNTAEAIDNRRYGSLTFSAEGDHQMHGIGGYFETTLYKDVTLSINPQTHSPGMFSWFPIYFPLPKPIDVRAGDSITMHFWRCVDAKKVWYEWCVSSPSCTPIQNVAARTYHIGL